MDYEYYKPCLDKLEQAIRGDPENLAVFDANNSRLRRFLDDQNKGFDRRNEIIEALGQLNRLTREIERKSFEHLCDEIRNPPKKIVDRGDPANFDLEEFDQCLDLLLGHGLIGISVTISGESARNFPTYLKRRFQASLEHVRGRDVYVPSEVSLNASHCAIEDTVRSLTNYKLKLDTSDILLAVRADSEERLARFWEMLNGAFGDRGESCLLVLIIKESEFATPQSIDRNFSAPEFKKTHVYNWVVSLAGQITEDGESRRKLIAKWADAIIQGCSQDQRLCTDLVYDHIQMSLDRLKKGHSLEALYRFFEDWKNPYA